LGDGGAFFFRGGKKIKKFLRFVVVLGVMGIGSLVYGTGSVTVYNANGSDNCATDTIQWGINTCLVVAQSYTWTLANLQNFLR